MNYFQLHKMRYAELIIILCVAVQVLSSVKNVFAEYPGNCTFEIASFAWHVEVYPSLPRHVFPTEENPFTGRICEPTRNIDSSGQYTETNATCEYKTVTSGEYWGMSSAIARKITLYFYDDNGWTPSDTLGLGFPCEPWDWRCNDAVVFYSNTDKDYLDSLRTTLGFGCPDKNIGPSCN